MVCKVECLIFCSAKRYKHTYPTPEGIGPVTPLVLDVIIRDSLLQLLHDTKQNECVSLKVRLLF